MSTATTPRIRYATLADVQERVGHVPESRILAFPAPGTATEKDLFDSSITNGHACELVDGILVEKAMGFRSDYIASWILFLIASFLEKDNQGAVSGAQSPFRFKLNLVRMPDVSFIRWDSVEDPDEIENPKGASLEVPPDLAVEVLEPREYRTRDGEEAEGVRTGRREVGVVRRSRTPGSRCLPQGKRPTEENADGRGHARWRRRVARLHPPVEKIFAKRAPASKSEKNKKTPKIET